MFEMVYQIRDVFNSDPGKFVKHSHWYCLRINQSLDNQTDDEFNLIKVWRALHGSQSLGISNRVFMSRYIRDGFWVRVKKKDSDIMLVFFLSPKDDLVNSGLVKHLSIRYRKATHMSPVMKLEPVKPNDNSNIYDVMDQIIEKELDGSESYKSSRFGQFFGVNKKIQE